MMQSSLNSPSTPEQLSSGHSTSPFGMSKGMDSMMSSGRESPVKNEQGANGSHSDARSDISSDSLDPRMRMGGYHEEIKTEMATVTA